MDHRGPAAQVGAVPWDVAASCPRPPKPSPPRPWGSSRVGAFLQCCRVPARLSLPGSEAESRQVLDAAPRLGRLKVALAKKTGRPESEITGLDDGRRRRSSRLTEEPSLELEEEEESRGRKSRRDEEVRMWPLGTGNSLERPSGISSRSCRCLPDRFLASPRLKRPPPASPSSSGRSRSWPRCAGGRGAAGPLVPIPAVPHRPYSPHSGRCFSARSCSTPRRRCGQPRWARTGTGAGTGCCPTWEGSSWRVQKVSWDWDLGCRVADPPSLLHTLPFTSCCPHSSRSGS